MQNLVQKYVNNFRHERSVRRRMAAVMAVLALIVASGVYWEFRLEGAALSNEVCCGREEHTHTEECYEEVLVCGLEESEGHIHTEECYQTVSTLVCGLEEREGHTHTDACYTTTLTCSQEESAGHTHTDSCYTTVTTLICTQEESAGHTHSGSCYDEDGNLICGQEESAGHTHTDGCYEIGQVLACGLEESAGHTHTDRCYTVTLACGQEESEGHTHTDACYEIGQVLACTQTEGHTHTEDCYETQLVCTLEEHIHTIECMIDETADVETASDWTATLPSGLTGDYSTDLVKVAQSQLGYTESTKNFRLADDGVTRQGYTRYGAWAGNQYGDWDAMFVSFCLNYANIPTSVFPQSTGSYAWTVTLNSLGMYASAGSCTPEVGDLVFFDNDGDGKVDHVGIIVACDSSTDTLTTIEGNVNDAVAQCSYSLTAGMIKGFGVMPGDSEAETESEMETESETEMETESETETETESETETETESEAETETETETEIKTKISDISNTEILISEGADYLITVTYDKDAGFPDDVKLKVSEYAQTSEVYQSRYAEAVALYGALDEFRLFDIGFEADGEKIEPLAAVSVTITCLNQEVSGNYTVIHFEEEDGSGSSVAQSDTTTQEGQAESADVVVTEMRVAEDYEEGNLSITFDSDSFSDYAVLAASSGTDGGTITQYTSQLEKSGSVDVAPNADGTYDVTYRLLVNPGAENLSDGSDEVTLIDTLEPGGATATLDYTSVKLYYGDYASSDSYENVDLSTLTTVNSSLWLYSYNSATNTATFTLPDEMAFLLVYTYKVDIGSANTVNVFNKAVAGTQISSDNTVTITLAGSGTQVSQGKLVVSKLDSTNAGILLKGAVFTLYAYDTNAKKWDSDSVTLTTDANGQIEVIVSNSQTDYFTDEDTSSVQVKPDTLYRLEETSAPSGYVVTDEIYYIIFSGEDESNETAYTSATGLDNSSDSITVSKPSGSGSETIAYGNITFASLMNSISMVITDVPTTITAVKSWYNSSNVALSAAEIEAVAPNGVELQLYQVKDAANDTYDTEEAYGSPVIVSAGNSWTATWENLPKSGTEDVNGVSVAYTYTYYVQEVTQGNYLTTYINNNGITSGTIGVINKVDYVDVSVSKVWAGDEGNTANRPETVTVNLYVNDEKVDGKDGTLNESNSWSYTWEDLPKYSGGQEIVYTIREVEADHYSSEVTSNLTDGFTVTNTYIVEYELPSTGGPGTWMYTMVGLLLCCGAGLLLSRRLGRRV
ncbi:MAG: Cna B-type domain-containing protein [Lachnospiraceae bacterium]|nr:Cna B-type domain-containing protein [Lachnospiraceae bacterium]